MALIDKPHYRNVYLRPNGQHHVGGPFPTRADADMGARRIIAYRIRVIPHPPVEAIPLPPDDRYVVVSHPILPNWSVPRMGFRAFLLVLAGFIGINIILAAIFN